MAKTAARVTEADVSRVLKAARKHGMEAVRVEIRPDGAVVFNLDTTRPAESGQGAGPQKTWPRL